MIHFERCQRTNELTPLPRLEHIRCEIAFCSCKGRRLGREDIPAYWVVPRYPLLT